MKKTSKSPDEKIVNDIKFMSLKHYSSKEKVRIVLDGLRGEDWMSRREAIEKSSKSSEN
ncbi:MAG: hypothetical protein KJP02_01590 [Octadecabacter sp.]|nr:hypothetical protein [Octadecabacter sp.]